MSTYAPEHHSQFADGNSAITRSSGCTWTTLAVGADAATGGRTDRTPDEVHALVLHDEESDPSTPGWSLIDASRAMFRLNVPFQNLSRSGWAAVQNAHAKGQYVVLQGDSDQFTSGCSGAFDGNHCIGIRPESNGTKWLIDDPICPAPRWEEETTLRRYAQKLSQTVLFGVFTDPVPVTQYTLTIRPLAVVRQYELKPVRDGNACINGWHDERWTRLSSSAPCEAPARRVTCDGKSEATTVRVLAGRYAGKHVRVGHGTSVVER